MNRELKKIIEESVTKTIAMMFAYKWLGNNYPARKATKCKDTIVEGNGKTVTIVFSRKIKGRTTRKFTLGKMIEYIKKQAEREQK